jgi:hypothetical protein
MLEHLVQAPSPEITDPGDFTPLDRAAVGDILSAQVKTADWLEDLGAKPSDALVLEAQTEAARQAFGAIALATNTDSPEAKASLAALKTPEAVRHLTGMLAAYDWEFIEQAKELRGYTVAQLVELTQHHNPNIKLKALGLLGKVTEVGLFTDKVEVKTQPASDAELDARIKEKLDKFMGVIEVLDVSKNSLEIDTVEPKGEGGDA